MANKKYYILVIVSALFTMGCRKYNELPNLKGAAYLRVFNDVAIVPNVVNNGGVTPFLTFLMDPVVSKSGIPENGAIVGDFLATRQAYSISYPYNAANTNAADGTTNYEYPGRAHVLTAPAMNGFDLSSWAQIPSGTHRLVFLSRPLNDTPFVSLSVNQRSNRVLIDTTVNFQAGEVYTLEAVLKNVDQVTYGAYLRQEDFPHHSFSADSIYLSFFNLSPPESENASDPLSPYSAWFANPMQISSSYFYYDYVFQGYYNVPNFNCPSFSLTTLFSTQPTYCSFPMLNRSYFFDLQGNIGTYDTKDGGQSYVGPYIIEGTLPYIGISASTALGGYNIHFNNTPVNFNNSPGGPFLAGVTELPNLALITNINGAVNVYSTLNIMEAVGNQFYMMQIQRGFNQIPTN